MICTNRYLFAVIIHDLSDHPIREYNALALTNLAAKIDGWMTQSVSELHVMMGQGNKSKLTTSVEVVGVGVQDSLLCGKLDEVVVLVREVLGGRAVDFVHVRELVDHGEALISATAVVDRGHNLIPAGAVDDLVVARESVGEDTVAATVALCCAIAAVVGHLAAAEVRGLVGDGLVAGGDLLAGCGVGSAEVLFEDASVAIDSGVGGGLGERGGALNGGFDYGLLAGSAGFEFDASLAAAHRGDFIGIDRGQQRSCGEKGESKLHCKERLWYCVKSD